MTPLEALVADELAVPVDPRVSEMAAAIAAHHPGSLAVLFYGSCLRDATLWGMLDFYLIVEDYGRAYDRKWLATANRLLPPNVFPFAANTLSSKYAVLSLADLQRETSELARDPSTFARLSQPARLVWGSNAGAVSAIAQASRTLLTVTPGDGVTDPLDRWRVAFAATYASELRAERAARPGSIVDADPARYLKLAAALGDVPNRQMLWPRLRRWSKWRQVAKLAKASLTFAGGVDYLAWKIARHSGEPVTVKPWQRRFPLLAAFVMLPRLIARGQVR
ncbi:Phosphatidate cytidylyltransferase [Sphingomonas antarctica]|uniref:hypothetical protein n=1 Tax=Sphingomonas antarctica TaxID=2040274 RepID=UPI0039EA958E